MNPHFLFNALNNLQSILFINGAEQANVYLCKFSTLMRSTLEMTRNNTTSLRDELNYIKIYLDFEQIRANDELIITYDVEENLELSEIEIPVMVVQTIIENAITHGLIPSNRKKRLLVKIYKSNGNQLKIIIQDNGIGRSIKKTDYDKLIQSNKHHKSYATQIISERFKILNKLKKQRYNLEIVDLKRNGIQTGTKVIITLPIIFYDKKSKI
ncbi:histidine kinase [Flavobacterium humidisoli]|uniref:Histidine kinase n=2 Tax=Flavobacterium humidisoli TaxID=2937442 RepID=A0ABY4LXQ9_9FLAO|nr:histidine kinase [Flavobacterium humidisoli]